MNRRERRADKARARRRVLVHGRLDEAAKKRVLSALDDPKYRGEVERFAAALGRWRAANPMADVVWKPMGNTLYTGDIDVREVREWLADSEAAHDALVFADVETGGVCSLLQASYALVRLGWRM